MLDSLFKGAYCQKLMNINTPKLKIWTATSVVIGCVIGSGVFVKPGRVLMAAGDSNSALLAWILGGLISLAGGLTLAEIGARIPKTGGIYVYMEELFGKTWGFVSGWVQALIYGPALISALSLYFASLLTQFFDIEDPSLTKPVALITLYALSGVTAYSTSGGALLQDVTTFVKLIPILVLGIAGIFMGSSPIFNVTLPTSGTPVAGMGVAILATLWAYDGWAQVSNMAEEIENPSKNLPRSLIIGLLVIMFSYILVNVALFHVVPVEQITVLNERTAAVASETLFGSWGGKALAFGVLISIFGCLNGTILTMTRVPYAMALRGSFPKARVFALLHPRFKTPLNSIILKAVIASIMILLLDPDRITDIAMFIMYLFYAAIFAGIILVRKKYGVPAKGDYKIPLYPLMPIVATVGSLYICYSMLVQAPVDAIVSVAIALAGIPVFYLIKKNPQNIPAALRDEEI